MPIDYEGSYAQQFVTFSISVQEIARLGDNFQSVMIFINDTDAATNVVTPGGIGSITTLTATTYSTLVESTLLTWLQEFYANNAISVVYIVEYNSATSAYADITVQFNKYKTQAFFKLLFETAHAAQVVLATDCDADPFSQCWIGTADTACLDKTSTSSLAYYLNQASVNPHLEFHETAANSAMVQLGASLGVLNSTGFAVGKKLDTTAVSNIGASGAAGVNLSATQVSNLKDQHIGYWSTVGDNTGNVTQFGGKTLKNKICGAEWFVSFLSYMCSALGSNYLNQPGVTHYLNNETYQGLLSILKSQAIPFENLGAISGFTITAPAFSPTIASGSTITVPNAWVATYNDNVRIVTIQGILLVTVS